MNICLTPTYHNYTVQPVLISTDSSISFFAILVISIIILYIVNLHRSQD